jgi:haloalkane dehalogenase
MPDARFANVPGSALTSYYVDIDGLRQHYVDEGPRDAEPVPDVARFLAGNEQ